MGKIIARYSDGRLLVREERIAQNAYGADLAVRIGNVKTVEQVISVDAHISGYPAATLFAPLNGVSVSGDTVHIKLYKADIEQALPNLSGGVISAYPGNTVLSGTTSGLAFHGQLLSGVAWTSGLVNVVANVIGL
jgi:hypothetical protein